MTTTIEFDSSSRLLVLAPHPDDETLGAGGIIQKAVAARVPVRVLFLTNGENNPWAQRFVEHRWRLSKPARVRWGKRRRGEALAALGRLGLASEDAEFYGLPDQGLTTLLLAHKEELVTWLSNEIATWRPTLIVAPSADDRHPDHNALAIFLRLARERACKNGCCPMVLTYLIHGQSQLASARFRVVLDSEQRARKRDAILCHQTQTAFCKSRWLKFATDDEIYTQEGSMQEVGAQHPVLWGRVDGGDVRIVLAPLRHGWWWLNATFLVVFDSATNLRGALSITPGNSDEWQVQEMHSMSVIAMARFYGSKNQRQLTFTLPSSYSPSRAFIKLQRQRMFFDASGWRELPVHSARATTLVTRPHDGPQGVCCVVPCYNVAELCEDVVRETARYAEHVVVIDDGSTDATGEVLRRVASNNVGRVTVLSFAYNRGKGVALIEAFRYALAHLSFSVLVTLDGDRQHRAADIPRLVHARIRTQAELVVAQRDGFKTMPWRSRCGNTLTSAALRRLYPHCPCDTQSGQRALQRDFVQEIVATLRGKRYETELEILLLALSHRHGIATVPIPAIYFNRNSSSHFRPLRDSLHISWALIRWVLHAPRGPRSAQVAELEYVKSTREQT